MDPKLKAALKIILQHLQGIVAELKKVVE